MSFSKESQQDTCCPDSQLHAVNKDLLATGRKGSSSKLPPKNFLPTLHLSWRAKPECSQREICGFLWDPRNCLKSAKNAA